MSTKFDLQALRRRIGEQERLTPEVRPVVPLGVCELDTTLPRHGLETGALHEILPAAHGDFTAALGFGLALAGRIMRERHGAALWILPAHQAFREGALHPIGLPAFGIDPGRLVQVSAAKPRHALWALEEGLAHPGIAVAIGVLPENLRAYDFTASRRLAMRAARSGATALLVRGQSVADGATAAATRWSIASHPGAVRHGAGRPMPGVGAPRWRIGLTKSKRGTTGRWQVVEWDHEALSFRLAAPLAGRSTLRVGRGQEPGREGKRAAAS